MTVFQIISELVDELSQIELPERPGRQAAREKLRGLNMEDPKVREYLSDWTKKLRRPKPDEEK